MKKRTDGKGKMGKRMKQVLCACLSALIVGCVTLGVTAVPAQAESLWKAGGGISGAFETIGNYIIWNETSNTVEAIQEEQVSEKTKGVYEVLYNYSSLFQTRSLMRDVGRSIGWTLVTGTTYIAGAAQNLYLDTFQLLDFTTWGNSLYDSEGRSLGALYNNLKYIFCAVLAASLLYLGIMLIVNHEKQPKILTSIVLMAFCISALGYVMETVNSYIPDLVTGIVGIGQGEDTVARDIVGSSVNDLYMIDHKVSGGIDNLCEGEEKGNKYDVSIGKMSDDIFYNIDLQEIVPPTNNDLLTNGESNVLQYRLVYTKQVANSGGVDNPDGVDGNVMLTEINTGMRLFKDAYGAGYLNNCYYRYTVSWLPILLTNIALVVLFICMAYKSIRIIFELAVYRVMAYLYSADVTGAQKTLRILRGIVDSYVVIFFSALMVRIFYAAEVYLKTQFLDNSDQPFVYSILLLFVTLAVIDGPNLIQQVTGIDAGLSSGVGRLMGAGQLAMSGMYATSAAARGVGGLTQRMSGGRADGASANLGGGNDDGGGPPPNGGGKDDGKPPGGGGGSNDNPPNTPPPGGGAGLTSDGDDSPFDGSGQQPDGNGITPDGGGDDSSMDSQIPNGDQRGKEEEQMGQYVSSNIHPEWGAYSSSGSGASSINASGAGTNGGGIEYHSNVTGGTGTTTGGIDDDKTNLLEK